MGFFVFGRLQPRVAAAWLTIASLFLYGWWNPLYVPLLVASIFFNCIVAWYIEGV